MLDLDPDYLDYADALYAEGSQAFLWNAGVQVETIYRIHDIARAFLWVAEGMEISTFEMRMQRKIESVGMSTLSFPTGFKNVNFACEYASFTEILFDDEKYSSFWLVAVVMDIYFLSGRLLHYFSNRKRVMDAQIHKLKKLCVLVHECVKHHPMPNTSYVISVNNDYMGMFAKVFECNDVSLSFKECFGILETLFTEEHPFMGMRVSICFSDSQCHVVKGKERIHSTLNDRTLENYFSKAKKIHKTRFCEK